MAGPAIRYYELARQLAVAGNEVTLASPAPTDLKDPEFPIVTYDADNVAALARGHEVILFHGWVLESFPALRNVDACLVADLYGPFYLELLVERQHHEAPEELTDPGGALMVLNEQLRRCDYFLCASEKQRDLWLGAMLALNRINESTYGEDPTLRSRLGVVPFGLPEEAPAQTGPGPRDLVPGIGPDDLVILWGSIYNWFDPLTSIRGVASAAARDPRLRLLFMGTSHPNPEVVTQSAMLRSARALSDELGLTGRHVFFNEGWVPYSERANWLLQSDLGAATSPEHVEGRFSYRTRFLDYFWAGLPVVCTEGDALADVIHAERLGVTIPAGDADAFAAGVLSLADPAARAEVAERVRRRAASMTWRQAARPLVEFCARPTRAPDLAGGPGRRASVVPLRLRDVNDATFDWRWGLLRAVELALYGGPRQVFRRARDYLRRRRRASR